MFLNAIKFKQRSNLTILLVTVSETKLLNNTKMKRSTIISVLGLAVYLIYYYYHYLSVISVIPCRHIFMNIFKIFFLLFS